VQAAKTKLPAKSQNFKFFIPASHCIKQNNPGFMAILWSKVGETKGVDASFR
jgi:hypothetical protein